MNQPSCAPPHRAYSVNTNAHVERFELRLFLKLCDDIDHCEARLHDPHGLINGVALADIRESNDNIAIADRVELEDIVVQADFIELIEEFLEHINDLIRLHLRGILREAGDIREEYRDIFKLIREFESHRLRVVEELL